MTNGRQPPRRSAVSRAVAEPGDKSFRTVFRGAEVAFGTYRCGQSNLAAGPEQHVAVPVLNVTFSGAYVRKLGRREELVDSTRVVFFDPALPYHTRHPCGGSDHGTYLQVRAGALAEILGTDARPWPRPSAPLPGALFLAHGRLLDDLGGPAAPDSLECESRLLHHAAALVRAAGGPDADDAPLQKSQRDLARGVQEYVAVHAAEPLALADLAACFSTSMYHLCRTFRRATGATVHGYRNALRLRAVVQRLRDGEPNLARLACEFGFSSHSHLTLRFRRAFGCPPSRLRART